ncbi:peptide deformylase [Dethiosulfatibacter aminovorans DSM 17477]|uniref:Peptide deformylase n=1 Tax=Dethiosulfatibacter aminovorans DSM 17477 TaxID=1121476 RepID=A0A1M6I964_9FIRM|nr:peptide deformylase [Dethiosulfatibacter aminovorans]SHJ30936.1 peptide deformylase [Dethiosulfatibacter aminovorans DSM 17477]
MIREIMLLGDERLYQKSVECRKEDLDEIKKVAGDLHDTMMDFREKYGSGRAIAAPQIGYFKRLIYMNTGTPTIMINPVLEFESEEKMEVMDDCMCFPGLLVKVLRYKRCRLVYMDENWERKTMDLEDDLSELIQHEYDHLDGILATMRVVDNKSFFYK